MYGSPATIATPSDPRPLEPGGQRVSGIVDLRHAAAAMAMRRGGRVEDSGGIAPDVARRGDAADRAAACEGGGDRFPPPGDPAQPVRAGAISRGASSSGMSSRCTRSVSIAAVTAKGGSTWTIPCLIDRSRRRRRARAPRWSDPDASQVPSSSRRACRTGRRGPGARGCRHGGWRWHGSARRRAGREGRGSRADAGQRVPAADVRRRRGARHARHAPRRPRAQPVAVPVEFADGGHDGRDYARASPCVDPSSS